MEGSKLLWTAFWFDDWGRRIMITWPTYLRSFLERILLGCQASAIWNPQPSGVGAEEF
jgi:hypothetical protein